MTRTERIKAAAARYGLTDPSPDDVLIAEYPLYNQHPAHTTGYHEEYEAVMELVDRQGIKASGETFCKVCGGPIPESSRKNKRYCSADCRYGGVAKRHIRGRNELSDDEAAEVLARYLSGESIETISKGMRRGFARVRQALINGGAELRPPGKPRRAA